MEKIITYLIKNGFVFPNSSIYSNLPSVFDYGDLGIKVKNNIKHFWRKHFITLEPENIEFDSAIFNKNEVWKNSGHFQNFHDDMVDCKSCKRRIRIDEFIHSIPVTNENYADLRAKEALKCPHCQKKDFTDLRNFQLMYKVQTNINETTNDEENEYLYLRPETAQGIFTNFKNIMTSYRKKIPFGVGQFGKVFRKEITTRHFLFKTKEFEQAELEYFCKPEQWKVHFDYYLQKCNDFLSNVLKLENNNLIAHEHTKTELAHYSNKTIDFLFKFPFGTKELMGISCRSDYDLKQHSQNSNQKLSVLDPYTNENYFPYIIEPSFGLDRLFLALICQNLKNESLPDNKSRVLLKMPYHLASYQLAVLPLSKQLHEFSFELYKKLSQQLPINITYDSTQNIGKRYRRQDEIGTMFCITIDFDTLKDNKITIRNRDTMEQQRMDIKEITNFFASINI